MTNLTRRRWRLAEAQNWRCCYCGIRMDGGLYDANGPSLEHIVPRSKGGGGVLSNLVVACRQCNMERGAEMRDIHVTDP